MKKNSKKIELFICKKRYLKSIKRKQVLCLRVANRIKEELVVKEKFGQRSKLITMIANSYKGEPLPHTNTLRFKIPKCFSIIENPEIVVGYLGQFAKTYNKSRPRAAQIDHSALINYDLAANGILDLIVVEAKKRSKIKQKTITLERCIPKKRRSKKIYSWCRNNKTFEYF